jgi:hypothetical protein
MGAPLGCLGSAAHSGDDEASPAPPPVARTGVPSAEPGKLLGARAEAREALPPKSPKEVQEAPLVGKALGECVLHHSLRPTPYAPRALVLASIGWGAEQMAQCLTTRSRPQEA